MRSPSKAPPVFRFEGSTDIIPILLSGKSNKNLLTISSTILDLPDPPVPVIPKTGVFPLRDAYDSERLGYLSLKFSSADITLDKLLTSVSLLISPLRLSPIG